MTEEAKIRSLIQSVRGLTTATFIRNGTEYSSAVAAWHMEQKWQKQKDQIHTAREFIERVATKSNTSGQTYQIRFADGKQLSSEEYLVPKLKELEAGQ